MVCCCRSVSATYQWGGVARLDLVSAPRGTALVFYGPPALHVHAMPLLSQHDLVLSAAAQPRTSQHNSAQHESAQCDSAQGDSAQLATAQHDSAQAILTQHNLSSSQQNGSVPSHNTEYQDAADSQPGVFDTDPHLSQTPQAMDSGVDDGVSPTGYLPDRQVQQQAHLLQAEPHVNLGYQEAAAGEEDNGDNEGLFAEASVLARGGLKVTEKASRTCFGMPQLSCFSKGVML